MDAAPGRSCVLRRSLQVEEEMPMQLRRLGRTDLSIAPLVLGGNVFGWTADKKASFTVLDRFLEAGLNAVDTADVYSSWVPRNSGGESETIIGEWMKARGNRGRVIVITKVGSPMGQGLSGKYRAEADLAKSPRGSDIKAYLNPRGFRILEAVDRVAAGHKAKPAEVALAWAMARPGVTAPIASATSVEQVESLVRATTLSLTAADIATLDQASAP
jgi:aryl-alcohol dehydrogenase-like predicted oxidoreductase